MERTGQVGDNPLVNLPRGTRQYWEGQYDALRHCAQILRNLADQNPTSQQLIRLAQAIEAKAIMTATHKLGVHPNGKHG